MLLLICSIFKIVTKPRIVLAVAMPVFPILKYSFSVQMILFGLILEEHIVCDFAVCLNTNLNKGKDKQIILFASVRSVSEAHSD